MKYELSDRDKLLVHLVSSLGQVDTFHLKALVFPDVSKTMMYRVINRLAADKLIRRVGVRATGHKRGTPPTVYQLGPKGWWYVRRHGDYPSITAIREHTLHVADVFTAFTKLDGDGHIKLLPDTNVEQVVGDLRVDLYLHFGVPSIGKQREYFVEMQEHARPDLIKKKLQAHWDAFEARTTDYYPQVAVVASDDFLKYRINKLVQPQQRQIVTVYELDEFIDVATRG